MTNNHVVANAKTRKLIVRNNAISCGAYAIVNIVFGVFAFIVIGFGSFFVVAQLPLTFITFYYVGNRVLTKLDNPLQNCLSTVLLLSILFGVIGFGVIGILGQHVLLFFLYGLPIFILFPDISSSVTSIALALMSCFSITFGLFRNKRTDEQTIRKTAIGCEHLDEYIDTGGKYTKAFKDKTREEELFVFDDD